MLQGLKEWVIVLRLNHPMGVIDCNNTRNSMLCWSFLLKFNDTDQLSSSHAMDWIESNVINKIQNWVLWVEGWRLNQRLWKALGNWMGINLIWWIPKRCISMVMLSKRLVNVLVKSFYSQKMKVLMVGNDSNDEKKAIWNKKCDLQVKKVDGYKERRQRCLCLSLVLAVRP